VKASQASDKNANASTYAPNYARLHASFGWEVPEFFNMAQVCSQRWASLPDATKRIAIHAYSTGATGQFHTYSELQSQANRL
jgi:acetyl-CoA synthetase